MKNFLLLFLSVIVFASCKKQADITVTDPNSVDNLAPISSGKISFFDDRYSESTANIYVRKDGVNVLGLKDMNYETFYYDTNVYLSASSTDIAGAFKISSTRKLHGDIYYPLSSAINVAAFKYLIIKGDNDKSPVAGALLQ